jgi:hypothetical protein
MLSKKDEIGISITCFMRNTFSTKIANELTKFPIMGQFTYKRNLSLK